MSRRDRRQWGKRALTHETRAKFALIGALAEQGFSPETIASKTSLPLALVEEILARSLQPVGEGTTYG